MRSIAHYQVLEKLGEGGMGVVYKARDTRLERVAALKILPLDKTADSERKRRFVQEAKSASALNHPNIITIYDIGAEDEVDFIAMEFVDGRTLDELIHGQAIRTAEALRIAVQIADALAAAHAAGIIHRDLKPGNIMVSTSGLVKVLDFGLAKLTEKAPLRPDDTTVTIGAPPTEEGRILGTIAYMSPEQAQGLTLDSRSDIFSFGSVLYEMFTGRQAFKGETKVSTVAAILNQEPVPLAPTMPRELDRIVTRCLRKDPARRFQTMADLKVALQELNDESESGRLSAQTVPAVHRRRWPLVVAGLAIAACAAGGAWWFAGSARPPANIAARSLKQITFDEGGSVLPSLSPDAKLVAYQSDRAEAGRYDIWVQQTSGGAAIRLTKGPGSHTMPAFSGDGTKIYFVSSGPPPGIYEVSTLGGESRLIMAEGTLPAVSPDGKSIAYIGRGAQLMVMPASGGQPRAIAEGFTAFSRTVLWSPEGQQIAFQGMKTGQPQTIEYWIAPVSGGAPQQTNWTRWAIEHKFGGMSHVWLPGRVVLSSLFKDGNTQIYRLHGSDSVITPSRVDMELLTSGGSNNQAPSVAAGKMVFTSGTASAAVWSLPADTNQGRITGLPEKLTPEKSRRAYVSATPDGSVIAFCSNRSGFSVMMVRDSATGQERTVLDDDPDREKSNLQLNSQGTELIYTSSYTQDFDVYAIPTHGGIKRKICSNCGPTSSLSPDGGQFLASAGVAADPFIRLVDVQNGKSTEVLKHSKYVLGRPRFSPVGNWIVFLAFGSANAGKVMLAPFRGAAPVPEQDWIAVTDAGNAGQGFWSPDGKLIYYTMTAGGNSSLMARRLDRNMRPIGPAFRVYEFTGRPRPGPANDPLTALPGRIVGTLPEVNWNIWMMDLPK